MCFRLLPDPTGAFPLATAWVSTWTRRKSLVITSSTRNTGSFSLMIRFCWTIRHYLSQLAVMQDSFSAPIPPRVPRAPRGSFVLRLEHPRPKEQCLTRPSHHPGDILQRLLGSLAGHGNVSVFG